MRPEEHSLRERLHEASLSQEEIFAETRVPTRPFLVITTCGRRFVVHSRDKNSAARQVETATTHCCAWTGTLLGRWNGYDVRAVTHLGNTVR